MKKLAAGGIVVALMIVFLFLTKLGRTTQFMIGGGLINLGYRMQDHLETYDFEYAHAGEAISPEQVWAEVVEQNRLASSIRRTFPRTSRHALVAVVVCMDGRLDTNEVLGDTRRYYYVLRTAGSVLSDKEEEMLELAVENGVKVVVLTTHSDCAAEKVAASPDKRGQYPALTRAVGEREERIQEFLARPAIAEKIEKGELLVKLVNIDSMTEQMVAD